MYNPTYFDIQELVSPSVYESRGHRSLQLMDERILRTADALREEFGPLTCNNWHTGGGRRYSGLRQHGDPYFSPTSQHSFGRALDLISNKHSADDMREVILSNPNKFPEITFLEIDISWLHIDCRNGERLVTWSPKTHEAKVYRV